MNEVETLRKFMQAAMDAEKYDIARQYLYLIEQLGESEDDDEGEMPEPMMTS